MSYRILRFDVDRISVVKKSPLFRRSLLIRYREKYRALFSVGHQVNERMTGEKKVKCFIILTQHLG